MLGALAFGQPARADDAVLERGRDYAEDFRQGRFEELWRHMTEQTREALGSSDALADLHASLEAQAGPELRMLSEESSEAEGYRLYFRIAEHEASERPIVTQFSFDEQDRIAGFFVRPQQKAADSSHLDYETRATLRLPFEGEWHVYWGGRTLEKNYHAVYPDQRFAYDFHIMRNGSSYAGDPHELQSYHCWGEPILAPADATVVTVVDGLPDQKIGARDPDNAAGNHVVLDFGEGEFGFLAHIRQDSISVAEGDRVEAGTEIGRCGNSGNTSEPHLHFHLQTTPEFGNGEGLPAFFEDYVADGETVRRGEPQRSQIVAPAGS